MRKKIEWKWEKLDESTQRAKVMGGWLILHANSIALTDGKNKSTAQSESMVFVADPNHEWQIALPFDPSNPGTVHSKSTVNPDDFAPKK